VSPVNIIICGAKGRMGRALVSAASSDPELRLAGEIDQGDDLAKVIAGGDVVIDFSVREATAAIVKIAANHKKALVIGTTGHGEAEKSAVRTLAKSIPIVWSANFSTGVNTLFWITQKVAEIVGPGWEAEVVETNPVPVKAAMAMMGVIEETYRLPLVPLADANRAQVRKTLQALGLVKA